MKKNFKISLISLIFFIFLSACNNQKIQGEQTEKFVIINNNKIYIEIADTSEKRAQGLSNRESLPEDHGMLFVFGAYQKPVFLMKDMRFPIDIIWIRNNTIIGFEQNILPETYQQGLTFTPLTPVDKVLEVNAFFIKNNKIGIGQKIWR